PLGLLRHREAATAVMGSHLCLRYRYFSRLSVLVKKNHLQSLTLSANPMQRLSSLHSLSVAVLSSPAGVRFTVKDVDKSDAADIWAWYSRYG
ncbi:MAG: PH domain-containing protein, partial [Candidatus Methanomethylophilaceae archaeon]|nr:PH domain-containing protein [Candidatus Methanomethylophilaceae archaeon]